MYQTAKVSKILLLAQNNCIDKYKGLNLNEIEVNDKILETQSDDNSEKEDDDYVTESIPLNDNPGPKTAKKTKRRLVPWSEEEKRATEEFFKKHIRNKRPPKKAEVMQLTEKYPTLFINRKWDTIKVYVQNKYMAKK